MRQMQAVKLANSMRENGKDTLAQAELRSGSWGVNISGKFFDSVEKVLAYIGGGLTIASKENKKQLSII